MPYCPAAVERAMKVHEVILRALSGQLTWLQAADILGRSPRSIRRLRLMYERYGCDALLDRRRQTPSPKRAKVAEVERLLGCIGSTTPASMSGTSCAGPARSMGCRSDTPL